MAATTTPTTGTTTTGTTATGGCPPPGTPPGGGQVGALVISRYVKAGTEDGADTFNHFSVLKTIEDLFSIPKLGYAKDPSLPEFDAAVFTNYAAG
ncbi:MAG: alkaline phosphatase family protein [Solirubrobacteraceae bacterium]